MTPLLLAASIVTAALAGPVHAQTSESVEYYGTDAVGSVRVVFDASGDILGRMDYAPFGGELFAGQGLPSQRFAGLFRDGEAGLDYAQARSYQVRTGRFIAPDSVYAGMFDPQQWNRYAYANNNPISLIDPEGLEARNPPLCTPEIQKLNPNDFHCQADPSALPGSEYGTLMWRNNSVSLDWLTPLTEVVEEKYKLCLSCDPDGSPLTVSMAGVPNPGSAGAAAIALAVAMGQAGERAVTAVVNIGEKIPFRTMAGRLRIPDGVTRNAIHEIKNVVHVRWTPQLADYLDKAVVTDRHFLLWVRDGATFSPTLQQFVDAGAVIIRYIPGSGR